MKKTSFNRTVRIHSFRERERERTSANGSKVFMHSCGAEDKEKVRQNETGRETKR